MTMSPSTPFPPPQPHSRRRPELVSARLVGDAVFFPAMADNIKKYEPATAARGLQSSARQAITVRSLPSSARAALAAACEMPPLRDAGADWCVEAATVES